MKINMCFRLVFGISCMILSGFLSLEAFGQQAGEVKDQEFIIRKDRVLTLPTQPRKFERVPALPSPKSNTNFNYSVQPFFLSLPPLDIKSEVAQKNFPKKNEELFPGFVRVGLGNYSSPLLEARYSNWEDSDYDFSAKVRHQGFYTGPVDGRNSAETFTNVAVDGTIFKDVFQLYGGLKYDRHKFNFYGYDPMNPIFEDFVASQNILNTFQLRAGIQNIEKMDGINYNGMMSIRGFGDLYNASENEIAFKANTDFWFEDYLKTAINMELSLTSPRDELYSDIKRNYFKINPYIRYQNENLLVKAGVNLVFENDITLNKNSDFHIFPVLSGQYMIQDEFGVYAGFEGDVLRNTYYDFVMENPFLGPSEQLLNTIQNFKTGAGIKGKLLDEFTYEAGFNVGNFRNMHFFANTLSDSLKFNMLYDESTRLLNYTVKLGWEYESWYKVNASIDYYQYTLSTLNAAYHRPEWEVLINNQFLPAEKWMIQFNAHLMGGIQGFNQQNESSQRLPAILDLQLKADYQITERISAFAIGNNLLNRTNQRFLNYPVRGIQGIIGATYKF